MRLQWQLTIDTVSFSKILVLNHFWLFVLQTAKVNSKKCVKDVSLATCGNCTYS